MPKNNIYHEITVEYRHHTPSAILIRNDGEEHWIPLSMVRGYSDNLSGYVKGQQIKIEVAEWILNKTGLDGLVNV